MEGTRYLELLKLAMPEALLVLAGVVALFVDLVVMRQTLGRHRRLVGAAITVLGCLAAGFWIQAIDRPGRLLDGVLVVDPLTDLIRIALLLLAAVTALISVDGDSETHVGEYFLLLLLATVGLMFLAGSENVLMIFVALELASLSLYLLTGFNRQDPRSAEAALKYFLFGGVAAAFTLFGLSLLYGLSGELNLTLIAARTRGLSADPLVVAALAMTLTGFGFKIAAVPFHLWAPDVYEGAPTPAAAFVASGSKVASFFVLAKVVLVGFAGTEGSAAWRAFGSGWMPLLAILASLSMVLGNLAAIVQSNVKRLLAYSAVAHAGYALLGLLAHSPTGLSALVYYVVTYGLATLGAFGVVTVVERATGGSGLSNFAGLARRSPTLAVCLMVFLLSLAGIPPLAGFFGKFYLFVGALAGSKDLGLLWLVVLAIAMSAVSLYYYLQVLKQVFVSEPTGPAGPPAAGGLATVLVVLLAVAVIVLGCVPNLLVERVLSAARLAGI